MAKKDRKPHKKQKRPGLFASLFSTKEEFDRRMEAFLPEEPPSEDDGLYDGEFDGDSYDGEFDSDAYNGEFGDDGSDAYGDGFDGEEENEELPEEWYDSEFDETDDSDFHEDAITAFFFPRKKKKTKKKKKKKSLLGKKKKKSLLEDFDAEPVSDSDVFGNADFRFDDGALPADSVFEDEESAEEDVSAADSDAFPADSYAAASEETPSSEPNSDAEENADESAEDEAAADEAGTEELTEETAAADAEEGADEAAAEEPAEETSVDDAEHADEAGAELTEKTAADDAAEDAASLSSEPDSDTERTDESAEEGDVPAAAEEEPGKESSSATAEEEPGEETASSAAEEASDAEEASSAEAAEESASDASSAPSEDNPAEKPSPASYTVGSGAVLLAGSGRIAPIHIEIKRLPKKRKLKREDRHRPHRATAPQSADGASTAPVSDIGESVPADETAIPAGNEKIRKTFGFLKRRPEPAPAPVVLPEDPEPEIIRLFDRTDEEPEDTSGYLQTVHTGAGGAARVLVNQTQTSRAVDESLRKTRDIAAQEQHEKYLEKQARAERRKAFLQRTASNLILGISVFAGIIALLYYVFLLKNIVVNGTELYTPEKIVEYSGLKFGQHLFFIDLDAVPGIIEDADPYIQVNSVEYIFPSRVVIDITERKNAAGIVGLDYNVIIDKNGYVLDMSSGIDLSNFLQITGVSMSGFQVGHRIGETSDFTTASLISLIDRLEAYNLNHKIKSIDMTTPLAIVMYTQNGFKIHIGQPVDLDTKFASLQRLLPRFEEKGIYTGTLYLSSKGGTVYSPQGAADVAATTNADSANYYGNAQQSGYVTGMDSTYVPPDNSAGSVYNTPAYNGGPPESNAASLEDAFQG